MRYVVVREHGRLMKDRFARRVIDAYKRGEETVSFLTAKCKIEKVTETKEKTIIFVRVE